MDYTQARTLFSLNDGEFPQDKYDEEIFRFKQFFVSKPPVPKLFFKKIKEMTELHEAAISLFKEIEFGGQAKRENSDVNFTGNWKSDYHALHSYRTRVKQRIMSASSAPTIAQCIKEWLDVEVRYINVYSNVFKDDNFQPVIVSKEPDPMEMLADMEKLNHGDSIENLTLCRKELPELLQNELKRLNLLTQYIK